MATEGSLPWIKSHQELEDHPKVLDLMAALGWDANRVIGGLHRLWWWCQKYAEDGDISKYGPSHIGAAFGAEPHTFQLVYDSLIKFVWIDSKPYMRIHDWWEYSGSFLMSKYRQKPEIWKEIQDKYTTQCNSIVYDDVRLDKIRLDNIHSMPKADRQTKGGAGYTEAFETFWQNYSPKKKVGKGAAFVAWNKIRPDLSTTKAIMTGLESWKTSRLWADGFVALPTTWLNQRRWEDSPEQVRLFGPEKKMTTLDALAKSRERMEAHLKEVRGG